MACKSSRNWPWGASSSHHWLGGCMLLMHEKVQVSHCLFTCLRVLLPHYFFLYLLITIVTTMMPTSFKNLFKDCFWRTCSGWGNYHHCFSSHLTDAALVKATSGVRWRQRPLLFPDCTWISQQHTPSAEVFFSWICDTTQSWIMYHFGEDSFSISFADLFFITCLLTFEMLQVFIPMFLGSFIFSIYTVCLSKFNQSYDYTCWYIPNLHPLPWCLSWALET